jgi:hypothetical protein
MSQSKEIQKFVMLSYARCGSNMLKAMLNEHPQITCFGEIFNPAYGKGYLKWVTKSFLRRLSHKYLRDYSIETYLNDICKIQTTGDTQAVGYKVMYPGQFERYPNFRDYWKFNKFKIIRLTRYNLLRRYLSSKIANKESRWSSSNYRGRQITIQLDLDDLKRSINCLESIDCQIDSLAQEFQYLNVSHEQIVSNRKSSLRNIFEFLGVDIDQTEKIEPRTVKQNPGKLNMLIENYDEVREALAGSQYERFLEE